MYLLLESAYFVVFVLLIIVGYRQWGLVGTGIACYGLVSMILMRRIRKIPMTHALKDGDSL